MRTNSETKEYRCSENKPALIQLVEYLNIRDEGDTQLFVDHQCQETHLGGTAVVELDGTLGELGGFVERVPAEVNESVTEVTGELGLARNVLHDSQLEESDEGNDLADTGTTDGGEGTEAVGDSGEVKAGVVDGTRETDSCLLDEVSEHTKHTNTSVLDLDVTETFELLLVTVGDQTQGVEEAKRRLGTKGILEGVECRRGSLLLGRGEGGGRGDKRCEDCELHGDLLLYLATGTAVKQVGFEFWIGR